MTEGRSGPPGIFITLVQRTDQLEEYIAPPPKQPKIPRTCTQNAFDRVGVKKANKTRRRSCPSSPRPGISSSPRNVRRYDCRINIGNGKHNRTASDNLPVPIEVERAPDPTVKSEHSTYPDPSNQQMALHGSHVVGTDSVSGSSSSAVLDNLELDSDLLQIVLQSLSSRDPGTNNSLGLTFTPQDEDVYGQDSASSAFQFWPPSTTHEQSEPICNPPTHELASAGTECAHQSMRLGYGCTGCGHFVPLNTPEAVPTTGSAYDQVQSFQNGGPHITTTNYALQSGIDPAHEEARHLPQTQSGIFSFVDTAVISIGDTHTMFDTGIPHTHSHGYPNLRRLTIPDSSSYRGPPSTISSSSASPASGSLHLTPASAVTNPLPSSPFLEVPGMN